MTSLSLPSHNLYYIGPLYHIYTVFTVPQNVKTIPEGVVVVDKDSPYHISCTVTGDMVPEVPWIHKEENMKDMNISGVTVTTERLQDTMGVISNVSFEKVTEHLVGDYVCHGGDGAGNVTVTLKLCNTSGKCR